MAVAFFDNAAAVPPATCNEVIFYSEDHEGSTDWTTTNTFSTTVFPALWSLQTVSGNQLWFADNWGIATEAQLESPTVTIPSEATNDLFVRFSHYFQTEGGIDGGIVEVNVGGGGFNDVGTARFTQNPYAQG
jgi:hypothetical protein